MTQQSDRHQRGLLYGTGAYLLWGVFPLYWPLLEPARTFEILAQRMVWSLLAVLVLLKITHGFGGVLPVVRDRRKFGLLSAAAVLVSVNWGVYIFGTNTGHVVETSLGYFINPLISILLGVVILGERLRRAQWFAVAAGGLAVVIIAIDYGRLPWIALTLGISFGLYGFLKKKADVGAADSLAVETAVMFVPAAITLAVIASLGSMTFFSHGVDHSFWLASTGLVTIVPLLLFAGAAVRLPLSVLGLLQYLAPVLQFSMGVFVRHESVPFAEYLGFCLVWLALAVLALDGLRAQRDARPRTDVEAIGA